MTKTPSSTTSKNGHTHQTLVLPQYTLDSPLVLLPGIIYNVTFSRFKAAALFARFRDKVGSVPLIKNLLSEYDFDSPESDTSTLSDDAIDGIGEFYRAETQRKPDATYDMAAGVQPSAEFDWLLMVLSPNLDKIFDPTGPVSRPTSADRATICRVVGISDDSRSVKISFQSLVRATILSSSKKGETCVSVKWADHSRNAKAHLRTLKESTAALFSVTNKFVEKYRYALANQDKKSNLLTLNPLANALFLQLAGSKDFERAYSSLQKIYDSRDSSDSARGLSRIIDLTVAIVPFPNHEKLKILTLSSLDERAIEANAMIEKITQVFLTIKDNNEMANHWFHNEASNIQKANLVANQLKSIRLVLEGLTKNSNQTTPANQKQLVRRKNGITTSSRKSTDASSNEIDDEGEDDDLRTITDFIKKRLPDISSISDDNKRLLIKDYKRIKNSPPGNADFHVIRNYLEIVADIPWDKYVAKFKANKDIDLDEARRQLDEDHYGLQHVKTRLLQYLVVLKLLGANAEREFEQISIRDSEKRKEEQKENRKFTRESNNGESIIIPNNDESRVQKAQAEEEINRSKDLSDGERNQSKKELLVSKNNKSPIIMLAGPPGVGKTSLAKSIATTLGRKFQRISLGGVKDESEIRGHRRTYIGAMAGSIVQALRKARSMNPVILLDEIDKVVGGNNGAAKFNGDPAAALLEVLDPEQNTSFMDHYLGFPIDLSQVIFICTANEPHNLSRPLLDRLEMIELSAYDYNEKLVIGNKYLLPRQIKRNGFPESDLVYIDDDVMKKIILDYTREAGVRNLERQLGTVCRFKAVEYSESLTDSKKAYQPKVEEYDLAKYLGLPFPSLSNEIVDLPIMSSKYGVVNGMSYNSDGSGSVLIFESIGFHSDKGTSLNMTGRLGEVLMESAKIGLYFIKNTLDKRLLNLENSKEIFDRLNSLEIHMHVPSGAISKDGPSAGITMATSFLSLILEKPVPSNIAMTGEITLRGLVLPIGGLKEKMLGAHLTGHIDKIIVPRENRRDILEEYVHKINEPRRLNGLLKDNAQIKYQDHSPEDYFAEKYGVRVVYAKEFWDVIKHVWGEELLAKIEHSRFEGYHL